jgi:uncharacterized protein YdhG (YjbR/CyaY superfamily)
MTTSLVDAYIAAQPEPQRSMLEQARAVILDVAPDAEQVISYAIPGFKKGGVIIAGLAATKSGISYYPHSGSVLAAAGDLVAGYSQTKSALHIPVGSRLSRGLAEALIQLKLDQMRA